MITVTVIGARGGHGATTIARVLAAQTVAHRATLGPCGTFDVRVSEGPSQDAYPDPELRLWVLRGPDIGGIEALGNAASHGMTELVVVHEPWRAVSPDRAAKILGVPLFAVVGHDPEVALAIDSGLFERNLRILRSFGALRMAWETRISCWLRDSPQDV